MPSFLEINASLRAVVVIVVTGGANVAGFEAKT
jgi:hypothetical protein